MDNNAGAAVDELVAKQAITEVIYRTAGPSTAWTGSSPHTVWHPDGTADYGPTMFQGTGRRVHRRGSGRQHAAMLGHSHQITNILIEVDGDRAGERGLRHRDAASAQPDGAQATEIVSRGRYVDTWSRRDGRWAIEHRRFAEDFTSTYPVTPMEPTDPARSHRPSRPRPTRRTPCSALTRPAPTADPAGAARGPLLR